MNRNNLSEGQKKIYEYAANKYFKTLHLYIEVNVDPDKPSRTSIDELKIFRDERKCIEFGKSRKDDINEHNQYSDYPTYQFYETVEFDIENNIYKKNYIE